MRIDVLTLFPEMFEGVFGASILGKAKNKGLVELSTVNFRDYANNKHNTVDDYPFGGGGGMVLKPGPIFAAVEELMSRKEQEREAARRPAEGETEPQTPEGETEPQTPAGAPDATPSLSSVSAASRGEPAAANPAETQAAARAGGPAAVGFCEPPSVLESTCTSASRPPRVILMCPQGAPFTQRKAEELALEEHLVFICGHYEGYDERIREHLVTDEISIGDYVLTGGELPAMVVIDSVVRLLPGVLGNEQSAVTDSFSTGLLEYPHYTRPAKFRDWEVPEVLLSGHHVNIERWRRNQSLERTWRRRPELLKRIELSKKDREWLAQLERDSRLPEDSE